MADYARARQLIESGRRTPRMYAACREAYIARVSTILEMMMPAFSPHSFYRKHMPTHGASYTTMSDPVDQEWADQVAQSALDLLDLVV